jgi:hypothetical protein
MAENANNPARIRKGTRMPQHEAEAVAPRHGLGRNAPGKAATR